MSIAFRVGLQDSENEKGRPGDERDLHEEQPPFPTVTPLSLHCCLRLFVPTVAVLPIERSRSLNLLKRILTAAIAAPIAVALIVLDPWLWFAGLAFAGIGLALWEFFDLVFPDETNALKATGVILGLLQVFTPALLWKAPATLKGYTLFMGIPGLHVTTLFVMVVMVGFLFMRGNEEQQTQAPFQMAMVIFGAAYIGLFAAHVVLLRRIHFGAGWLIILFVGTWLSDTGGYFFGKGIGGPKLYPSVSPNKTWAGLFGCFVGATLSTIVLKLLHPTFPTLLPPINWVDTVVLGIILSLVGQVGDFCESLLKRAYHKKDSGSLLPGHGGLFDRLDSLVFSAPVVFYYVIWVVLPRFAAAT